MSVTAVIPNWNGGELLARLLQDLAAQTVQLDEVLVIDNGSGDGSDCAAEQNGARLVRLGVNAGFAVAVNRGIELCRTDYIAILNNDVELDSDWLKQLLNELTGSGAWFATGKILNHFDRSLLDGTFDAICRGGCAVRCGQGKPDGPAWQAPRTIGIAPFTALVLRADLFARIGKLEESFGSYLEDVDFGLRSASGGYTGRYVPEAIAYHRGSATLGRWNSRTVRFIARNQVLLIARHYPRELLIRYGWAIAVAHLLWGLVALRHGAGFAYLAGKIEGLRLFGSARRNLTPNGRTAALLGSSEREIYEVQRMTGFDWYWRLYFALT